MDKTGTATFKTGSIGARLARFKIKQKLKYSTKTDLSAYLFILPAFIIFGVFMYFPIVKGLLMSFQNYRLDTSEWVGLKNYLTIFRDEYFIKTLWTTTEYTFIWVFSGIAVSLIIALVIDPLPQKIQTFFKSAFYLPGVVPSVVMAIVWTWLYDPNFGLLNFFLQLLGFKPVMWLSDPKIALYSVIFSGLITGLGANILILAAGLGAIPAELYESARTDGASMLREIISIKIPLVRPSVLYLLVVNTVGSFQIFDRIYLLTGGGPNRATMTIGLSIYNSGFKDYNFGVASAQAVILMIIVGTIAFFQFKFLSTDVEY